jgi:type VI secretion system secreted protein Hcp
MSKLLTSTHSWLRTRRGWMLALAAALLFGLPFFVFNGFGASDYLLEIEGIKGESSDTKHKDTIEISSFSWGMTQTGSSAGGGGAGKVSVHDISITKSVDKSSPKLMLQCCTGQHIPTAMLYYSKVLPLGARVEYLKIKLSDILVSGYNFAPGGGGGGGLTPTDSISLNFTKIEMTYIVHDANGVPGEVVTASCDLNPPAQ